MDAVATRDAGEDETPPVVEDRGFVPTVPMDEASARAARASLRAAAARLAAEGRDDG